MHRAAPLVTLALVFAGCGNGGEPKGDTAAPSTVATTAAPRDSTASLEAYANGVSRALTFWTRTATAGRDQALDFRNDRDVARKTVRAIRRLDPPALVQHEHQRLLAALSALAGEYARAARGRQVSADRIDRSIASANRAAQTIERKIRRRLR